MCSRLVTIARSAANAEGNAGGVLAPDMHEEL
jgi:hypothetical protein